MIRLFAITTITYYLLQHEGEQVRRDALELTVQLLSMPMGG